jgi:hypothetical protein
MSGYAESVLTTHKTLPSGIILLSKPVNEPTLLRTVRNVLDGSRPLPSAASLERP